MKAETYNEDKFRTMILYFADRSKDDPTFGSVKLNKLLFFADFYSYAFRGKSISGAKYIHLAQGPGASKMLPVRNAMEAKKEIEVKEVARYGYIQHVTVALVNPNLALLEAEERAICDLIFDSLSSRTGTDVSNMSHQWNSWLYTDEKEEIPYSTVFAHAMQPVTRADFNWADSILKKTPAVAA